MPTLDVFVPPSRQSCTTLLHILLLPTFYGLVPPSQLSRTSMLLTSLGILLRLRRVLTVLLPSMDGISPPFHVIL